jgi:asparagine synthase (glutamine-hydrolysing)
LYEEDVRFTLLGVQLARSQALVRTPLADKDLLRFALTVPPGYRVDNSYYVKALIKALPDLAKIPYAATGQPLDQDCFRALRIRTVEQSRWWLQRRGLHWIPVRQAHPYADYGTWFRHELRPWVEETLLSTHALDRGYFQPAFVRNMVAEHMAGCEHTHRLGVLLALELWHQQYMD